MMGEPDAFRHRLWESLDVVRDTIAKSGLTHEGLRDPRGIGCASGMVQAALAHGGGSANRQVLDIVLIQDHLSGKLER